MTCFIVIGHLARTDEEWSLNDMPGSAGRMDVLSRCVNASLFLSHDLRRDVDCCLALYGGPDAPKTVKFSGRNVRYLNPDERSAGALLKKALGLRCGTTYRESTPGVFVRKGGLPELLWDHACVVLDVAGSDIRCADVLPDAYLLSDHLNFTEEERESIRDLPKYSVGPQALHADHTITVVLNEIDRRRPGWR
ncbi:MAG: tRNA (pseudouridine(54)-N(1))-methyltransferase TrmY [Methanoregulaceae archaeon]|nr:tRNA (pseudouridine(54)-N(1))-methyltransferase TrmY [Methanoregulaceae archaeon]